MTTTTIEKESQEALTQALEHIQNPLQKLNVLLELKMIGKAHELFLQIINDPTTKVVTLFLDSFLPYNVNGTPHMASQLSIVVQYLGVYCSLSEITQTLSLKGLEMEKNFQWYDDIKKLTLLCILRTVEPLKIHQFLHLSELRKVTVADPECLEIIKAIEVLAKYLPEGSIDLQNAQKWCLIASSFYTPMAFIHEDWQKHYLGFTILDDEDPSEQTLNGLFLYQEKVMQAFIERLRAFDMTDNEIVKICYDWLKQWIENNDIDSGDGGECLFNPHEILGLTTASIFKPDDFLRKDLLAKVFEILIRAMFAGNFVEPLTVLYLITGKRRGQEALFPASAKLKEVYDSCLAREISEGFVENARHIHCLVGEFFSKDYGIGSLEQYILPAFDLAFERGNYGLATAIAESFSEGLCSLIPIDLKEVTQNGLTMGDLQRILTKTREKKGQQIKAAKILAEKLGQKIELFEDISDFLEE